MLKCGFCLLLQNKFIITNVEMYKDINFPKIQIRLFSLLWFIVLVQIYGTRSTNAPTIDKPNAVDWCASNFLSNLFNDESPLDQCNHELSQPSFFYHKTSSVKSIVEQVCNAIRAQDYTIFNNPYDGNFQGLKKIKMNMYMTLNYRKNIIKKLQKDEWGKISNRLEPFLTATLPQLKDENQKQTINQYFASLQYLHELRIESAGFQALGGGYCGEVSSYVSYNMLRAFDASNIEIPSITQITLNKFGKDNVLIDAHAISVIDAVPRKPGEVFFDSKNPEHTQGFLCDPWNHQFGSFMPLAQIPEREDFNPSYIAQTSVEIGQFPDISEIPEELKAYLEQLRLELINHPYIFSDSDRQAIHAVRDELDYIANYNFESFESANWLPNL